MRPRWPRWSLRVRLTAAATVALALLLAAAAGLLVWRVHATLLANLDDRAQRQALAVAAQVNGARNTRLTLAVGEAELVQVLDLSGHVVAASADIQGEPASFNFPVASLDATPGVRTVGATPLGDGPYRVAAVLTQADPRYRVYVGLPLADVRATTTQLGAALGLGVPGLLVALGAITWLLTGRALRPVERLRRQAAEITVTDLHQRVDVPPGRDQLARLADTLNDLLARLDHAVRQQRQFIADAAHELRSPVAAIRAQLEVTAHLDPSSAVSPAVAETIRLSRLVDDLLALAGLDAQPLAGREAVDLDDLAATEAALLRARTPLTVDTRAVTATRVAGDPALLTRALRNLLDNAAQYATTRIELIVRSDGCEAELTVADDGPGIPPIDRLRVLQRFTRLDGARTRDSGGVGLGLAIVHDIATAHGGHIQIDDNHPGARVTLRLPTNSQVPERRKASPRG